MKNRNQKLIDLKQQRATKVQAQKTLLDTAETESRDAFTPEEKKSFDDLDEEIRSLGDQIQDLEKMVKAEERAASLGGAPVGDGEGKEKKKMEQRFSYARAINAAKASKPIDGVEAEISAMAFEEARAARVEPNENAAFAIPAYMLRASDETSPYQTVTEDDGEYGGALVETQVRPVIKPLLPRLRLEDLGLNVLSGLVGNLALPTAGEYSFEYYEETEEVAEQKSKFGKKSLSPKRMAANVGISNQLLIQTNGTAERLIREALGNAAAMKLVSTVLQGTGRKSLPNNDNVLEPLGILNMPNVQQGTAEDVPTLAALVELETLLEDVNVDPESLAYILSPKLKGLLKTTKLDEGSGKMLLSDNDELNGYKYIATTLLKSLSDGAGGFTYPMIFGDWSQAYVGLWGGAQFIMDPYTKASANTTRLIVNMHNDFQVASEKAFAVNKKFTLTP